MKTKRQELDVDFIGGQGPLTAEEEKALSDFFKKRLQSKPEKITRPASSKKRVKVSV